MAHTYTSLHYHIVFSTRGRRNLIPQEALDRLHSYMGGIVRRLKGTPIAVGGTMNHAHVLASVPSTLSLSHVVGKIKANSSKWARQDILAMADFGWQEGYSAFTVSRSKIDSVAKYIAGQMKHHDAMTFEEEFVELLRKHGVDYDERYIWD